MNPAFAIRSRLDVPFWLNREATAMERRRCAPVQFDDSEEIERGQSVSKSKRMRLSARSSFSSTDSSSIEDSEEERKDKVIYVISFRYFSLINFFYLMLLHEISLELFR